MRECDLDIILEKVKYLCELKMQIFGYKTYRDCVEKVCNKLNNKPGNVKSNFMLFLGKIDVYKEIESNLEFLKKEVKKTKLELKERLNYDSREA